MIRPWREQGLILFLIAPNPAIRCEQKTITALGWDTYARHQSAYVRRAVAARQGCPQKILRLLANDSEPAVRASVIDNPDCHPWVAEDIFNEEWASRRHPAILQAAAWKEGLLPSIYRRLYETAHWYALIALAHNRSCLRDILRELAELPIEKTYNLEDKNREIRAIARKRLGMEEFVYQDEEQE